MNNTLTKTLVGSLLLSIGVLFADTKFSGELSSDISVGDSISFSNPYTGLRWDGDGWGISGQLTNGGFVVEEAKYTWSITDKVELTFGSQALPYGIAWGLHRPASNSFVSLPREHTIADGIGVGTSVVGVGIQAFYGNNEYWAGRVSYSLFHQTLGLSVNSDDALLVDVASTVDIVGFPVVTSLEYDLSEDADGAFWLRSTVTPEFAKGASLLLGYNSDEEVLYGLSYKCTDKCFITTELSAEGDKVIRVSYSF